MNNEQCTMDMHVFDATILYRMVAVTNSELIFIKLSWIFLGTWYVKGLFEWIMNLGVVSRCSIYEASCMSHFHGFFFEEATEE